MPTTVDGKYYSPLEFTSALEYITLIAISLNLIQATIAPFLLLKYIRNTSARRFFISNFILLLIWEISKIGYFYADSHPITHFIYGIVVPISSLLITLFQLELLRIFRVLGYQLSNQSLVVVGILNLMIFMATGAPGFLRLISIGHAPPHWIQTWYRYGYPIYISVFLIMSNCQLVFVSVYLTKYMKKRKRHCHTNQINTQTPELKMLRNLLFGILFSICSDFTALSIWFRGWLYVSEDGFTAQKIQLLGTEFGALHLTSICICYFYTQQLFLTESVVKNTNAVPKSLPIDLADVQSPTLFE